MTAAQEKYATMLRQKIMATAKAGLGWDSDTAHQNFAAWGYGESLRQLTIDDLLQLKSTLYQAISGARVDYKRQRVQPEKPGKPLPEVQAERKSAKLMATEHQINYAGVLARRYAELRKIPADEAFACWHEFVNKYQKIDHIQWCSKRKATVVLAVMERAFITTFGADEFYQLTGHTWMYRGERYAKYCQPTANKGVNHA